MLSEIGRKGESKCEKCETCEKCKNCERCENKCDNKCESQGESRGFYRYHCKNFYSLNCPNWVWVNTSACAICLAEGKDQELLLPSSSTASQKIVTPNSRKGAQQYVLMEIVAPNEFYEN